jgi:hypothetical protein
LGVVPGGDWNHAAALSFAAGHRSKATNTGAFVWADSTDADFTSQVDNQFRVRANGGARFDVNSSHWVELRAKGSILSPPLKLIDTSSGAYLSQGGTWTDSSDRMKKENFQAIDPQSVLAMVGRLPISTWNYKVENEEVRHIGPVAQDFYAVFGVGGDDKHIAALDGNGVALAAIQGLNQKLTDELKQKGTEIAELKEELSEIKRLLVKLSAKGN